MLVEQGGDAAVALLAEPRIVCGEDVIRDAEDVKAPAPVQVSSVTERLPSLQVVCACSSQRSGRTFVRVSMPRVWLDPVLRWAEIR
jgi:hypothetical protein